MGHMSDEDTTQAAPRAGTYADLARRMDRMETKHEDLAKEVSAVTATTGQIVLNQQHAETINDLRFKAIDTAVGQVAVDLKTFMTRMESLLTGETQTATTKAIMDAYNEFRSNTEERLVVLERRNQREQGIFNTLGYGKQIIIVAMAIMGTVIAIADFIVRVSGNP